MNINAYYSIIIGTSTVTAIEQIMPDISDIMATSPLVYFFTAGRQQSIPVDPGSEAGQEDWKAILEAVLPDVDFFEPSLEELCYMLDRPRYDELAASGRDMTELPGIRSEAERLAEALLELSAGQPREQELEACCRKLRETLQEMKL